MRDVVGLNSTGKTLYPGSSILFTLIDSTYSLERLIINVRTRATLVALVDVGGRGSVVLVEGSVVVYIEDHVSLVVDASINDGSWHKILVLSTTSATSVSPNDT